MKKQTKSKCLKKKGNKNKMNKKKNMILFFSIKILFIFILLKKTNKFIQIKNIFIIIFILILFCNNI